jgi:hypothetical protein
MERILTVHPIEGSLAKLMLLIGFGYNQGLLIEEIALNNAAAACVGEPCGSGFTREHRQSRCQTPRCILRG